MEKDFTKKRLGGTFDFVALSRSRGIRDRELKPRTLFSEGNDRRLELKGANGSGKSLSARVRRIGSDVRNTISRMLFWGRTDLYRVFLQIGFILLIVSLFIPYVSKEEIVLGASGAATEPLYFDFGGDVLASDVIYEYGAGRVVIPADRPNYGVEKYIVQRGDTLSEVAKRFDVNADTIRWANNLTTDTLRVGQELEILPVDGVLHTVKSGDTLSSLVKKYKMEENGYNEQSIVDINLQLEAPYTLGVGMKVILPGAIIDKPVVATKPKTTTTSSGYKTSTGGVYVPSGAGLFVKPVAGGAGKLSQRFHKGHDAVDIASNDSPDIIAAASGKVIMAGWKTGGCGYGVIIDHNNGFKTKYCHLASYYVKVGESVVQGQRIGKMGSTGRSTGIHVHFSIYYRDVAQNPLNYIKI